MILICALIALGVVPLPMSKQESELVIQGAQSPSISPDGRRLAFSWRGDIYAGSADGGVATPLTSHVQFDGSPVFSPNGKWIAFASTRNGSNDIYIVPAAGGPVKQITKSPASEIPAAWTADSTSILYSANRESPHPGLYSIKVDTLRVTRITEDFRRLGGAALAPNGKSLVFTRDGFPWTRPRYRGSAASQLWLMDTASKARTDLTHNVQQYLWPHFTPNGKSIICVTTGEETANVQWLGRPPLKWVDNPDKTPNIWSLPVDGSRPTRLTSFVGGSVRYPSVADKTGDIAFAHGTDIYIQATPYTAPKKLRFTAGNADEKTNITQRFVVQNNGVGEAELSPDGKLMAFLVNNDLWTIPVDKEKGRNADIATRVTDWIGFDRDFIWTPDNKKLIFVSDRDGNDKLFATDLVTKQTQALWSKPETVSAPKLTPDSKRVSFWVGGAKDVAGYYVCELDGTLPRRIVAVPTAHQGYTSWSPDGKYLAFSRVSTVTSTPDIFITLADGTGSPINVTRLATYHGPMTWSPDGKYLYFASNRDGDGLYAIPLQPVDVRPDDAEPQVGKTDNVKFDIDFNDIQMRIIRITTGGVGDITALKDGRIIFVQGGDITTCTADGKNITKLTQGGGVSSLRISPDEKTASFLRGAQIFILKGINPGTPQPLITFNATGTTNLTERRKVAFNQFWRAFQTNFYDNNFHGRDWTKLKASYEPMLAGVATNEEMATLLNMMAGELEASHSEVGAASNGITAQGVKHLGVTFDASYDGPGIKIATVPALTPGSFTKTKLTSGEYIVAINDKDCNVDEYLWDLLAENGDRDIALLVNNKPSRDGARTVKFRPLSNGEWSSLIYRNRISARRTKVETTSDGKIGYVHIAGMGEDNQNTFEKEFYSWAEGKQGMIIDVRENGGGNIGDRLVSWLRNKPYSMYVPRDGDPKLGPPEWAARTFPKMPIVVLMGENSFSNAEMFPYGMKATGLATLIGKPTPGYVIWTSGFPLIDGTSARMPGAGVYRIDGSPMENLGEKPDIDVDWPLDDYMAGRDPQLERAIKELFNKK